MIDYFALALTHALLVIALLRIAARPELDREECDFAEAPEAPPEPTPREAKKARRKRKSSEKRDA